MQVDTGASDDDLSVSEEEEGQGDGLPTPAWAPASFPAEMKGNLEVLRDTPSQVEAFVAQDLLPPPFEAKCTPQEEAAILIDLQLISI